MFYFERPHQLTYVICSDLLPNILSTILSDTYSDIESDDLFHARSNTHTHTHIYICMCVYIVYVGIPQFHDLNYIYIYLLIHFLLVKSVFSAFLPHFKCFRTLSEPAVWGSAACAWLPGTEDQVLAMEIERSHG